MDEPATGQDCNVLKNCRVCRSDGSSPYMSGPAGVGGHTEREARYCFPSDAGSTGPVTHSFTCYLGSLSANRH